MADVVEINDLESLAPHRMAWTALLDETPRASFFHTYQWLEAYWRHFGEQQKLRVLIVRAAGKTIGIVPLIVKAETRQYGKLRVLTYPLDNWGAWYSPIGGNQAATLTLAMRHIASTERDWDTIDLPGIDHLLTDRGRTARAMQSVGLRAIAFPNGHSEVLQFKGDWDQYLSDLDSKQRSDIRRVMRRVEECGDVTFIRHRPRPACEGDGNPAWTLYDQCEEVASLSWQAKSPDGNTICDQRYRPFLRDAHEAAARLGMVDMNLLEIDGQAVAFSYNYHYHGDVFGLRTGYRTNHPQKGIGRYLILRSIQDSFTRGDHRLEMGTGGQRYKKKLGNICETPYRLIHAPISSWRSQAARLSSWARGRWQPNAKANVSPK